MTNPKKATTTTRWKKLTHVIFPVVGGNGKDVSGFYFIIIFYFCFV